MPAVETAPTGPVQRGRGVHGQYVYLIVFSHPTDEAVAAQQLQRPSDFTRASFRELVIEAHAAAGVQLCETAAFEEQHQNGHVHLNLLVRSPTQYRWKEPAAQLRNRRVHVDFAAHIKTWSEGVAYLYVPSDHKPADAIDREYEQWAREGQPTPLDEFLPSRFLSPGFRRKTRLSSIGFLDMCTKHGLQSLEEVWAKASELSEGGDRGLLAYLLDNNAEAQFTKVMKARSAAEQARRSKLTRESLLQEHYDRRPCTCTPVGHCYSLMKDLLVKNGMDGRLQGLVLGALRAGRAKKRTICLIGAADCGKTFLFRGFTEIFSVYERPDSGSYQLEELEGKELVLLNDFTYDEAARSWMSWPYLKNFLEGGSIPIGKSKSAGGRNTVFTGSAPVLMTAPAQVKLFKRGGEVVHETTQMDKRIEYVRLEYAIPEAERQEVLRHCGHCTARLYLEGRAFLATRPVGRITTKRPEVPLAAGSMATGSSAMAVLPVGSGTGISQAPAQKRPRTAASCIAELKDLKALLDAGALTEEEFQRLKQQLLAAV